MRRTFVAIAALALTLGGPRAGHAGEKAAAGKDQAAKPAAKNGAGTSAKPRGKKPAKPPPLDGTTVDFAYDGKDVGHTERAWSVGPA